LDKAWLPFFNGRCCKKSLSIIRSAFGGIDIVRSRTPNFQPLFFFFALSIACWETSYPVYVTFSMPGIAYCQFASPHGTSTIVLILYLIIRKEIS
jgi:hypothetical protein